MKKLHLLVENETVVIRDSESDQVLYRIIKQQLPSTRDGSYSEWIMQLFTKTWINTDILYKLAQLIKREFPDNIIDWRKTFFAVEKSKYLDSLGDVLTAKSDSITKNLFTKIELGLQKTNEDTHEMVNEILEVRLKEFGLL
jgi:hypothetical protein